MENGKTMTTVKCAKKYFAAKIFSNLHKRVLEYRCEEGEILRKTSSVSSVICKKSDTEILVGRIQNFLCYNQEELALVKWYGEIERDENTKLWKCVCTEETFNTYNDMESLSKPLVHAWDGHELWVLNYHEQFLGHIQ